MLFTPERIDYLKRLEAPPPWFKGTGATELSVDPRDWRTRDDPLVQQMIPRTPETGSLLDFVTGDSYDQGPTGACVAASTSGLCSTDTQHFESQWNVFHWLQLYHEAGGTGSNGVDSRLVLQICKDQGTPLATGGRKFVVASYDFVTQSPGSFREEIKACIALGYPVVVALLLPSDFGWKSGQPSAGVTTGYHQIMGCAYDSMYLTFLNSWGNGWPGQAGSPRPGVGSIRWDYLEASGMQNRYCYAYRTTAKGGGPTPIPDPIPTPTPRQRIVTGRASGANVQTLAVGQQFSLAPGIDFQITQIAEVSPDPGPGPGPDPNPDPNPNPDPGPGGIKVLLTTKPSSLRNKVSVVAYTVDTNGNSLPAAVNGHIEGSQGSVQLGAQTTGGTNSPAIWQVQRPSPWGTACQVTVNASAGGLTGTETKSG